MLAKGGLERVILSLGAGGYDANGDRPRSGAATFGCLARERLVRYEVVLTQTLSA